MAVNSVNARARGRISRFTPRVRAAWLLPVAVMVAFGAEAFFFVTHSYLNRDEGWYTLSGQLAYHGSVPYRDFPYFQMPLVPYVFGLAQTLFAPTITTGRVFASVLGAVSSRWVMYAGNRHRRRADGRAGRRRAAGDARLHAGVVDCARRGVVVPLTLLALVLALRFPTGLAGFAGAPAVLLLATAARLSSSGVRAGAGLLLLARAPVAAGSDRRRGDAARALRRAGAAVCAVLAAPGAV